MFVSLFVSIMLIYICILTAIVLMLALAKSITWWRDRKRVLEEEAERRRASDELFAKIQQVAKPVRSDSDDDIVPFEGVS